MIWGVSGCFPQDMHRAHPQDITGIGASGPQNRLDAGEMGPETTIDHSPGMFVGAMSRYRSQANGVRKFHSVSGNDPSAGDRGLLPEQSRVLARRRHLCRGRMAQRVGDMITVTRDNPLAADCAALLADGQRLQATLYPDNNHALPTAALSAPDIRFFAARDRGQLLGVGALAIRDGFGEVKSMFSAPGARGRGVGDALLDAIEAAAKSEGLRLLRLETGEELGAACRLYRRRGFIDRGAFGSYDDNGCSVFMEKRLD